MKIYICPKCGTVYKSDDDQKICSDCQINAVDSRFDDNKWYSISRQERDEIVKTIKAGGKTSLTIKEQEELEHKKNLEATKCMLLTTGNDFQGYKVVQYIDVIYDEVVSGLGFLKSIAATFENGITSLTGSEATIMTDKLEQVKKVLKERVMIKAVKMGANALLGIDFERSLVGSLLMTSMSATAVVVEKIEE